MIKYKADDYCTLDIREWSRPHQREARLDKFLVAILDTIGIDRKIIMKLLREQMERTEGFLKSREGVERWLRRKGGNERAVERRLRTFAGGDKDNKERTKAKPKDGHHQPEDNWLATQALSMVLAGHALDEPRLTGLVNQLLRQEFNRLHDKLNIEVPVSTASQSPPSRMVDRFVWRLTLVGTHSKVSECLVSATKVGCWERTRFTSTQDSMVMLRARSWSPVHPGKQIQQCLLSMSSHTLISCNIVPILEMSES